MLIKRVGNVTAGGIGVYSLQIAVWEHVSIFVWKINSGNQNNYILVRFIDR